MVSPSRVSWVLKQKMTSDPNTIWANHPMITLTKVHKIGNAAISEFKRALHEAEKLESAAGRMDLKGLMLTPRGGQKQGGSASTSAGSPLISCVTRLRSDEGSDLTNF